MRGHLKFTSSLASTLYARQDEISRMSAWRRLCSHAKGSPLLNVIISNWTVSVLPDCQETKLAAFNVDFSGLTMPFSR